MARAEVIGQLNSFLRGELSAVETYHQALERVESLSKRIELQDAARSHEQRVHRLQELIASEGGEPAEGSGPWGVFAKLYEGAAAAISEDAAIAALEEGEDHGLADYRADVEKLDPKTRHIFEREILSEQIRTHAALSALKHAVKKAPAGEVH